MIAVPPRRRSLADPGLALSRQSPGSLLLACVLGLCLLAALDPALRWLATELDPRLHAALRAITRAGNAGWPLGLGLTALAVLRLVIRMEGGCRRMMLALRRVQTSLLFLLSAVALSGILSSLIKNMIGRARPSVAQSGAFDFRFLAFDHSHASFPSGHATTAMATAVALALIWPRQALALWALGGFVALTRALIGVHWFSDVVAGAGFGALVTLWLRARLDGGRRRALISPRVARLFRRALMRAGRRIAHGLGAGLAAAARPRSPALP